MIEAYAISLAAEGVPVCVIARSLKIKSEDIRTFLKGALEDGRIVVLPPEDWLQKSKEGGVLIGVPLDVRERAARRVFGVSSQQSRVLLALLLYPMCSRERLDRALNRDKDVDADHCDYAACKVVVFNIRHKMERHSWFAIRPSENGYYCDGAARKKALAMVDDYCVQNF